MGGITSRGQAFLFDATTGSLARTFDNPTPALHGGFSQSVSVDGNLALIGSNRVAYLYDLTTGGLLHTFNDPTPAILDIFAISVALDGNNVLIGDTSLDIDQAHLFDAVTGNLLQTFNDPTPTTDAFFGSSVSISADNILIGGHRDDTAGTDVGQAYLFTLADDILDLFPLGTPQIIAADEALTVAGALTIAGTPLTNDGTLNNNGGTVDVECGALLDGLGRDL